MDELRPTHCWVRRTLYLKGTDASITNEIVEFDDLSDVGMAKTFIEILLDIGRELGIHTDFSPVKMEAGRYIIQSEQGFSVVEIDPAWTEEQVKQMEAMEDAAAPRLDMRTWGSIFTVGQDVTNE